MKSKALWLVIILGILAGVYYIYDRYLPVQRGEPSAISTPTPMWSPPPIPRRTPMPTPMGNPTPTQTWVPTPTPFATAVSAQLNTLGGGYAHGRTNSDDVATFAFSAGPEKGASLVLMYLRLTGAAVTGGFHAVHLIDADTGLSVAQGYFDEHGYPVTLEISPAPYLVTAGAEKKYKIRVDAGSFNPGNITVEISYVGDVVYYDQGQTTPRHLDASQVPITATVAYQ